LAHRRGVVAMSQHTLTGLSRSMIANRISYALGLRGPSLVIDTGQSSALVAVHVAAESLHRGESTIALAGGVNLNVLPDRAVRVSRVAWNFSDDPCELYAAAPTVSVRWAVSGWACRFSAVTSLGICL
jgi:acyl transferase domain-containing protein